MRATMNRLDDRLAKTAVLPRDELAVRREQKRLGRLTLAQIQRLLIAAELRKKATQGENDE
jgi:hypothetical protein